MFESKDLDHMFFDESIGVNWVRLKMKEVKGKTDKVWPHLNYYFTLVLSKNYIYIFSTRKFFYFYLYF